MIERLLKFSYESQDSILALSDLHTNEMPDHNLTGNHISGRTSELLYPEKFSEDLTPEKKLIEERHFLIDALSEEVTKSNENTTMPLNISLADLQKRIQSSKNTIFKTPERENFQKIVNETNYGKATEVEKEPFRASTRIAPFSASLNKQQIVTELFKLKESRTLLLEKKLDVLQEEFQKIEKLHHERLKPIHDSSDSEIGAKSSNLPVVDGSSISIVRGHTATSRWLIWVIVIMFSWLYFEYTMYVLYNPAMIPM